MDITPQIQKVISSKYVSKNIAMQTLKKFLVMQKKYFQENESDTFHNGDNEEEYFNLDDQEHTKLGYEEFEQRLNCMLDSLSDGYYLKKRNARKEKSIIDNVLHPPESSRIDRSDRDQSKVNIKQESEVFKKNEDETSKRIGSQDESQGIDSKTGSTSKDKDAKKKMKEMKKAMKKEEKEAKRALKKEAKEAKKAEKDKEKKLKKEKKEKRKREKEEMSSTKKHKI